MDITGQFFIVQKHMKRKGKLQRRKFHEQEDLDEMIALARTYAARSGEDFLIVQVVHEVSKLEKKEG